MSRQRHINEIMADPEASEEELVRISVDQSGIVLHHPNCPREIWWEKAERLPIEAITSPAYPLMTLEAPDRWIALELENAREWFEQNCWLMSEKDQWLLAADCAEHTLPLYEATKSHTAKPKKAIKATRLFAEGKITQNELMAANEQARIDADAIHYKNKAPSYAARAVFEAAWPSAISAVKQASRYAAIAASESMPDHDAGVLAGRVERVWQWHRLLWYLKGRP